MRTAAFGLFYTHCRQGRVLTAQNPEIGHEPASGSPDHLSSGHPASRREGRGSRPTIVVSLPVRANGTSLKVPVLLKVAFGYYVVTMVFLGWDQQDLATTTTLVFFLPFFRTQLIKWELSRKLFATSCPSMPKLLRKPVFMFSKLRLGLLAVDSFGLQLPGTGCQFRWRCECC